jgi:hypothetical protein
MKTRTLSLRVPAAAALGLLLAAIAAACGARSHVLFTCGTAKCDSATQYCSAEEKCVALPDECVDSPSCQCLVKDGLTAWPDCYCDFDYACTLHAGDDGGPADAGSDG